MNLKQLAEATGGTLVLAAVQIGPRKNRYAKQLAKFETVLEDFAFESPITGKWIMRGKNQTKLVLENHRTSSVDIEITKGSMVGHYQADLDHMNSKFLDSLVDYIQDLSKVQTPKFAR